jgi:hypothetical protein
MGLRSRETKYVLNGVEQSSRYAALGLWQLLPEDQRPNEIWFLLTPQADRECWESIVTEAVSLGVPVEKVRIDSGAADDTRAFLESTANQIPRGCALTLDVTQGLRHHAFLFYALALYLSGFRGIRIRGAWYCRIETEQPDDPKPVIDLKPALSLAYWFHALAVFRETGSLNPISQLMQEGQARALVEQLSFFFLNGMPLEAGDSATQLVDAAERTQLTADLPLAHDLQRLILDEVRPLAGPAFVANPKGSQLSKKDIPLTAKEVDRQAVFIERYLRSGQFNLAFGLFREWIVNYVGMNSGSDRWLDRTVRESIERNLGGLGEVFRSKDPGDPQKKRYKHQAVREGLSEGQRNWAARWSRVCDLRNALQHHGMKRAVFDRARGDICKAEEDFRNRAAWGGLDGFGGGYGRLLICPLGLTPGVLYSAVSHARPDRVLVICSDQSEAVISQAITNSGQYPESETLFLTDPHSGIEEFNALMNYAARWLYEADEVHANLTGGTTLMGVLVGQLMKRASREYQRPLREFVLIDKRPPEQQRTDPWQLGDIHYLDDPPPNDRPGAPSD